jgi:hypothetical protein
MSTRKQWGWCAPEPGDNRLNIPTLSETRFEKINDFGFVLQTALLIIAVMIFARAHPESQFAAAILLRESYRAGDKFKRRTLANLSNWPAAKIEALRRVLRDEVVAPTDQQALTLLRSLPHHTVMWRRPWACYASAGSTGFCRRAAGSPAAWWRCTSR